MTPEQAAITVLGLVLPTVCIIKIMVVRSRKAVGRYSWRKDNSVS